MAHSSEEESGMHSQLVTVTVNSDTHPLHVMTNGVARSTSEQQPMVVFVSGLGSDCLGFCNVMRRLSAAGIPALAFDRKGVGRSGVGGGAEEGAQARANSTEKPPSPPPPARMATELAQELDAVLTQADVPPPYVLVPHSYAGVIAREYLALDSHAADVLGMVCIESNCQHAADRKIDVVALSGFLNDGAVDFNKESGLDAAHKLRADEWAECAGKKEPPSPFRKGTTGATAEAQGYVASCRNLSRLSQYEKKILGRKPISVLKGNATAEIVKVLDAADAADVGDQNLKKELRKGLGETDAQEVQLQSGQLKLAEDGAGRFQDVRDAGHSIHVTHPDLVAEEIQWVLGEIGERGLVEKWKAARQ